MKTCRECKITKLESSFRKAFDREDGLQSSCRECQNISTLHYYGTPKGRFCKLKAKAKERGHSLEFKYEEYLEIVTPSAKCYYCSSSFYDALGLGYGLDRIDSKRGYAKNNVVACCIRCNKMKLDLDSVDFLAHIRKILDNTEL